MALAEDELRPHLDRGEKLLWAGQPTQGMVFTAMDWYYIPFSAVWLGLVFHVFGRTTRSEPAFWLVALLFITVGLYFLVGRFLIDWLYRSRLIYGITDRRAIIVSSLLKPSVRSIDFSSLTGLKLEERGDGSGTISFGDQPLYGYGQQFPPSWGVGSQFFRVADVKKVYAIVRDVTRRLKGKG
jgi:hypothetical protein